MSKKAAAAGVGAAGVTGGGLVAVTAGLSGPAANLGGYATAQIVASASGASALGIGGPALTTAIAAMGGPITAGIVFSGGVGFLTYGSIKLIKRWLR